MEKQSHQSATRIQEAEKMACGQCPGQEGGRKRVCSSTQRPREKGGRGGKLKAIQQQIQFRHLFLSGKMHISLGKLVSTHLPAS